MTPLETAMKLASASATCEKHKCPFASKCKGDYTSCAMKEIALMLRSQQAEIDSQKEMIIAYQGIVATTQRYIAELEKINKRYHDLVIAFQNGYRPKRKKHNVKKLHRTKMPIDPVMMDGNERYAYEPPPASEPEPPLVVI